MSGGIFLPRKLFCEYGPLAYSISTQKEKLKRNFSNLRGRVNFAHTKSEALLPHIAATYSLPVATEIEGIPTETVRIRADNVYLSAKKVNLLMLRPGETFSFWHTVGNCTPANGYGKALILHKDKLVEGYGGGLCLLSTIIQNMVVCTPLKVVELHYHSDALYPDKDERIPYDRGISVLYNYIDYRFQNTTEQKIQLRFYKTSTTLTGELRSERPFQYSYKLVEEDHHFAADADGCFYRNSKIYRLILDRNSGEVVGKELVRDNHSQVMYDPNLIPKALLRDATAQS